MTTTRSSGSGISQVDEEDVTLSSASSSSYRNRPRLRKTPSRVGRVNMRCESESTTHSGGGCGNNNNSDDSSTTTRVNLIVRALVLFVIGALMAFVLNLLQMEHRVVNLLAFFQLNWWVLPVCGCAAIYIGLCYPFFDHKFGECHYNDRDWTLIIRSFALFIGLNHLTAKIQFASSYHFLMILIVFCILFWYWFDKTKFGLLFNMFNSFSVLTIVHVMKYFGVINFSGIHFNYFQICLLCLIFSGGVTFGNIGRLLEFSFLFQYERQQQQQQQENNSAATITNNHDNRLSFSSSRPHRD